MPNYSLPLTNHRWVGPLELNKRILYSSTLSPQVYLFFWTGGYPFLHLRFLVSPPPLPPLLSSSCCCPDNLIAINLFGDCLSPRSSLDASSSSCIATLQFLCLCQMFYYLTVNLVLLLRIMTIQSIPARTRRVATLRLLFCSIFTAGDHYSCYYQI